MRRIGAVLATAAILLGISTAGASEASAYPGYTRSRTCPDYSGAHNVRLTVVWETRSGDAAVRPRTITVGFYSPNGNNGRLVNNFIMEYANYHIDHFADISAMGTFNSTVTSSVDAYWPEFSDQADETRTFLLNQHAAIQLHYLAYQKGTSNYRSVACWVDQ